MHGSLQSPPLLVFCPVLYLASTLDGTFYTTHLYTRIFEDYGRWTSKSRVKLSSLINAFVWKVMFGSSSRPTFSTPSLTQTTSLRARLVHFIFVEHILLSGCYAESGFTLQIQDFNLLLLWKLRLHKNRYHYSWQKIV